MNELAFTVINTALRGVADVVMTTGQTVDGDELAEAVISALDTELMVTISGTTMHLAAWRDPDHWEWDWAKTLGIDGEAVAEAVAELLTITEEVSV